MKVDQLEIATAGGTLTVRGLEGKAGEIAAFVEQFPQRADPPDWSLVSEPLRRVTIEREDIPVVHGMYASVVDLTVDGVPIHFNCWALDKLVEEHWAGIGRTPLRYRCVWNDALAAALAALDEVAEQNLEVRGSLNAFTAAVRELDAPLGSG
jgi:hypothetical protein